MQGAGGPHQVLWIPPLGISFFLAEDGLELIMLPLTTFLGMLAVLASWRGIQERVGFFHFNLLWTHGGDGRRVPGRRPVPVLLLLGMMLVPMYFLIGIWGHERRVYAAIKFFIFTQASGLLMLVAILGCTSFTAAHGRLHLRLSQLLGTPHGRRPRPLADARLLRRLRGQAAGRAAAHLAARRPHRGADRRQRDPGRPAAQDRRVRHAPLRRAAFPAAAARSSRPSPWRWRVVGILYGAVLAFAQTDLKRLVAYTSVSHMGFVLLGVFAWNALALQGAVMQMVCHGLSTGGAVHPRRRAAGAPRTRATWIAWAACGQRAADGRRGHVLRHGLAGPAGPGQFRGRVPRAARRPGRWHAGWPCVAAAGLVSPRYYALWMMSSAPSMAKRPRPAFGRPGACETGIFAAADGGARVASASTAPALGDCQARESVTALSAGRGRRRGPEYAASGAQGPALGVNRATRAVPTAIAARGGAP